MRCYITTILAIVLFLFSTQYLSQSNSSITQPDTTFANQYFLKAIKLAKKAKYDSSSFYYKKAGIQYNEDKLWVKYVICLNRITVIFWRPISQR